MVHRGDHRQPRRHHRRGLRPGRAPRPRPCPALDRAGRRGPAPDRASSAPRPPPAASRSRSWSTSSTYWNTCGKPPGASARPRDPAAEDWVTAQGLDILHGQTAQVISRIQALAAAEPPRPGSEHDKIIARTLAYLTAKEPYLDYPRALAEGWPIATGVIEGACRHLVPTGWASPAPAGACPAPRPCSGSAPSAPTATCTAYWTRHITHEHHRNHLSRYHDDLRLAA